VRPSDSRFEREDWLAVALEEAVTEAGAACGEEAVAEADDASGDEAVAEAAGLGPREYVCSVGWVIHVLGIDCWCESAVEQTVSVAAKTRGRVDGLGAKPWRTRRAA
jgi:hypothetical protein